MFSDTFSFDISRTTFKQKKEMQVQKKNVVKMTTALLKERLLNEDLEKEL